MNPLATGTLVIIRNDLRLFRRAAQAKRGGWAAGFGLTAALVALAHLVTIPLCVMMKSAPPLAVETLVWTVLMLIMLLVAGTATIEVLYERSDFDLLLGSPIQPAAVLLARLGSITATAFLGVIVFVVPLVDGAIIGFSPRYAAGFLVWGLLAVLAAALGAGGTLLLVRWFGARQARVLSQIAVTLLGVAFYLIFQAPNFIHGPDRERVLHLYSAAARLPGLMMVARAGRGEPAALAELALLAAAMLALAAWLLARVFITGLQEVGAISGRRRKVRAAGWTDGLARATFRKDFRLIARDPLLLVQTLPQMIYLMAPMIGIGRMLGLGALAPLALIVASQASVLLAAVCANGEECWDLIRMSPSPEFKIRLAKMVAGMAVPVGMAGILCAVLVALGRPGLALLALAASGACAAASAWLQVATITPTPRQDLLRRGRAGQRFSALMSLLYVLPGAFGLGLVAAGHWAVGAVCLVVCLMVVVGIFSLVEYRSMAAPPA